MALTGRGDSYSAQEKQCGQGGCLSPAGRMVVGTGACLVRVDGLCSSWREAECRE